MRVASPLRYPGGKASLTSILCKVRSLNRLNGHAIAEPFAGGAGASLTLLYLHETHEIHINDLDPAIHDFWFSAVYNSAALLKYLEESPVSVEEWKQWRAVYQQLDAPRLERGFAAFYLNRCNRSGIIRNGGVIGGIQQNGRWKIDARFNKETLQERLELIAQNRERIHVSNLDGIEFIDALDPCSTMYFIDPPYFKKGSALYLNSLDFEYHRRLADKLQQMSGTPWVLTYDDCAEIRGLYSEWAAIHPYSLRYTARERYQGREVVITPKWLQLPAFQGSPVVTW